MPKNSDRVLTYLAAHLERQNDDQIGEALHIDRIQINAICRRLAEAGGVLPPNGSYSSLRGVASGDAHGSE